MDLNPVRAGIVDRPDDYRWSSFGYHQQNGNKDGFLSLDFGLVGTDLLSSRQRLCRYRQFVYGVGSLATGKGMNITEDIVAREAVKDFEVSTVDRFRARTRYFADNGIIGSRGFVSKLWHRLERGSWGRTIN